MSDHDEHSDPAMRALSNAFAQRARRQPGLDATSAWNRVRSQLPSGELPVSHAPRTVVRSKPDSWLSLHPRLAIVGVGVMLLVAVSIAAIRGGAGSRSEKAGLRAYATGAGERMTVMLADGSRATVAPLTTLSVQGRTVRLTGEAYFEVDPTARTPFLVQTGTVTTRVLGTAFSVRRYTADTMTQVIVRSGKVMTGGARTSMMLVAGTVGQVTDSTATRVSTGDGDVSRDLAWTVGRLEFENAPVSAVIATLGRWYDYDFRMADSSIGRQRISATFKASAPAEALQDLRRLLGVRLQFDGRSITLIPRTAHEDAASKRRFTRDTLVASHTRTEVGR